LTDDLLLLQTFEWFILVRAEGQCEGDEQRTIALVGVWCYCVPCNWQVEDVHAPLDRETSERRPFVFVTFESSAAADEACDERSHSLGGKDVSLTSSLMSLCFSPGCLSYF